MYKAISKLYLLVIAAVITLSFSGQTVNSGPMVTWYDVQSGFANSRRLNKWLVADFYTSWCGWCKKMERDTFEDPTVENFLSQSFVCTRVNAEDNGLGQQLARDCDIHGYPTVVIFDPQGKPRAKHTGYLTAAQFLQVMSNFTKANNIH